MSSKFLQSDKQNLLNCIGTELCWGWSPAIDMLSLLPKERCARRKEQKGLIEKVEEEADNKAWMDFFEDKPSTVASSASLSGPVDDGIHILLCGASDIRHIFKTLAKARLLPMDDLPTIHFHIYEPNLRVHTRHFFFLQWLCDSLMSFAELEDRVALFLEVFGNSLVRDITAAQIRDHAAKALRALGYNEGLLANLADFSEMKSKEKDFIEQQLKCWVVDKGNESRIAENWQSRLRTDMAERFDNKNNIIDWDYNFGVIERTHALKYQEYRLWRNTGICYDYAHINPRKGVSYEYTQPNKTLCHFQRPVKGVSYGLYVGDIKNGPFFSFGIDTENEFLQKRTFEGTLKYGNGVVAMHNVRAWLYELLSGRPWPWTDHVLAWDNADAYNYLPPGTPKDTEQHMTLPKCRFHFIGLEIERMLLRNSSNVTGKKVLFDAVFVGSNCAQFMTKELFAAVRPDLGVVVAETLKFMTDANDEAFAAFTAKLCTMAEAGSFTLDLKRTADLHKHVPELKKRELPLTEAQQKVEARYKTPWALVFEPK